MPRFDKLLVLDLDETLIHATAKPQSVGRAGEHAVGPYAVYRRPHLDEFLRTVLEWFDLGVWTSSSPLYATQVVQWLGLHGAASLAGNFEIPKARKVGFQWVCSS